MYETNDNVDVIDGHATVDVCLWRKLFEFVTAKLEVENLFNNKYATAVSADYDSVVPGLVISKIRKALSEGKCVAILDSGDSLIYGPWGWCLEEFEDADPLVVPGLSCFNAANAALKRDVTWSDTLKTTILTSNDWYGRKDTIENLARQNVTMVIFTMGLGFKDLLKELSDLLRSRRYFGETA